MSKKHSQMLEGFIRQQHSRGESVTPELLEHLEDVKYDELPWWRKKLTESPSEKRRFAKRLIRAIPEWIKEQSEL